MQIVKPLEVSLLQRSFQYKQQYKMTVTSMFGFKFSDSEILLEADAWNALTQELNTEITRLDSGFPKQQAEFLVYGSFYSPTGQSVQESYVQAKIGSLSKTLAVVGDRYWDSSSITAPMPFKKMPINFEHAFGGSACKKNPLGKGLVPIKNADGKTQHPLPNIELANQRILTKADQFTPASFGAIDINWEPRSLKLGTYDEQWQKKDAPGLASDIDWSAFNTATADQRLKGFFTGNESFEITHMHAKKPVVQGKVPPIRPRTFALQNANFKEIDLNFETLILLPNVEIGIMLFRGVTTTSQFDASDITDLLLAYENLSDPKRELNHYQDQLKQRTDPETKFKYALSTVGIIPTKQTCGFQRLLDASGENSEGYAEQNSSRKIELEKEKMVKQAKLNIAQMATIQGVDPKQYQVQIEAKAQQVVKQQTENSKAQNLADQIAPVNTKDPSKIDLSKIDFSQMEKLNKEMQQQSQTVKAQVIAELETLLKTLKADGLKESAQNVQKTLNQLQAKTPYPRPQVSAIQAMLDFLQSDLKEQALPATQAGLPSRAFLQDSQKKIISSFLQGYKECAHLQKDMQPTKAPNLTSEEVLNHLAEKKNIAYQDYSGADLNQKTIEQANLSQTFLEEVNLANSCLVNVDFHESILCKSKFNNAQCTKVNFSDCNLGCADFQGACFTNCNFKNAILEQANLHGSCFNNCEFENVNFLDCQLSQLKIQNSLLEDSNFINVKMENCNFQKSTFTNCNFLNNQLKAVNFSGSNLTKATFTELQAEDFDCQQAILNQVRFVGGACFKNANFARIKAQKSNFSEAVLNECNFNHADLREALFAKSQLRKVNFEGVQARLAQFQQADLTNANLQKANLAESSLRETRLLNANFNHANLYGAEFFMATFGNTLFNDANLEKTKIEFWRPN